MSDSLPSFSESSLTGRVPKNTEAAKRLCWPLRGPLQTSVFVLEGPANPDGPREAYFHQTLGDTSWHPISQEPLIEPQVSSVSITLSPLNDWEEA
ncbi:hypothetical protein EDB80DRAFT_709429, partial [Ilyonectria destructans]